MTNSNCYGTAVKKILSFLLFLVAVPFLSGADVIVWNSSNDFKGWHFPHNCEMKKANDMIILNVTAKDSSIRNNSVKIPTDQYDAFEVDYRATGLPAVNNGEIYYAGEGKFAGFIQERSFNFQNIPINTTDWKTIRITLNGNSVKLWQETKLVTKIRLDLFNQAPGTIEIREIRVMPKMPELADSREIRFSRKFPEVKYEIPKLQIKKIELDRPYYSGFMMKSAADIEHKLPREGARFAFCKKFNLSAIPQKARLHIGADDAYTSRLNGQHLSNSGLWYKPHKLEVEPSRFLVGENSLVGIYYNGGGPGGVYFELEMLMPDNTIQRIVSDKDMGFAPTNRNDWKYPSIETVYVAGIVQNLPPGGPWGNKILPFEPLVPNGLSVVTNDFTRIAESGKTYFWHIKVAGPSYLPTDQITLHLNSISGRNLDSKKFVVSQILQEDGSWKIPVTMPKYMPSAEMVVNLVASKTILPEIKKEFSYRNTRKKGDDFHARVRKGEVYLNGKIVRPMLGYSHSFVGKMNGYHLGKVELRGVIAHSRINAWWNGENQYDFSAIDQRINTLLELDESVGIIVYTVVTPPNWWAKLYPVELARRNDGTIMLDHESKVSFASSKFREDASRAFEVLIKHMQNAPYSDRIAGYVLCGGTTQEWLQWDPFDYVLFSDYSAPAEREFTKYLAKYAPEMKPGIPTVAERKDTAFGFFLDPVKNRRTLLYTRFLSEMVSDSIEHISKHARKVMGEEKLLGIYYGYSMQVGNMGKILNGSHGAMKRILDLDELDFYLCPMTYGDRNFGNSGEDGMPFGSIRAAGRMPVVEDDIRTHLQGIPQPYYQAPNAWLTEQSIRRSLGRTLSRNQMAEYLAITTGTEFNSPTVMNDFRKHRSAIKFATDNHIKSQPEIAVVVSSRAMDYFAEYTSNSLIWNWEYINNTGNPQFIPHLNKHVTGDLICFQRSIMARIGAPLEYLLAEDLEKVADRPYKLWIFLNLFETTPKIEVALKKIQIKKNTCIFMYAPGIFKNDKIDFANMEKLTGIKLQQKSGAGTAQVSFPEAKNDETRLLRYRGMGSNDILPLLFEAVSGKPLATYPDGKVGVAMAMKGKSRSIFCGVPKLSTDFLRSLANQAGVWLYNCNSEDVLFANNAFITLHATEGGKKVLRFPRKVDVVDIFTGKLEAENVTEFCYNSRMHETRTFYYGNDSKKFQQSIAE